ncbi:hypothetical protein [Flavobacterium sp. XGLA_31]|uniref:hypothetical protein n=1 Tax=Flavobacterium sp. XGLA_31 TaxID=3447666 RepID=UPI003F37AE09
MKKVLVLLLFFVITSFKTVADDVYICDSKYATKYHYSDTCRGLNACKHEIVKLTVEKAKKRGFTLCGFED